MAKFFRVIFAAAIACGMYSFSMAATTSVPKPDGLTDLTDDTASRVTTTSTTSFYVGPTTAFHNKGVGNTSTSYRVIKQNPNTFDIIYTFDEATAVNAYAICAFNNGMPTRPPKKWSFYGSNDYDPAAQTGTWTPIDSRDNETDWGLDEYRYFQSRNTTKYKSYRIDILENNGETYTQFNFMEFFFNPAAETTVFGDCSLTYVEDGEYALSGVITANPATSLSLILTPVGDGVAKQITLDVPALNETFNATINASEQGLSTTTLYAAKLVGVNDCGTSEEDLGTCFFGPTPVPSLFFKKIDFTLSDAAQSALGAVSAESVPVAVRISEAAIEGFSYDDLRADGSDLIFGAGDGTDFVRYPYEVEEWNPAGESVIWVKVPTLAASTAFTMYYGNGVIVIDNVPTEVWSGYAVVFHGSTFAEATGKGVSGSAGSDKVTATATSGWLGGGFNKSTCNSIGLNFTNPINAGTLSSINQMTISGWYRPTKFKGESTTVNSGVLAANRKSWSGDGNGFLWLAEAGKYLSFSIGAAHNGSTATGFSWAKDQWSHFASTYDNKTYANYCNATLLKSDTAGAVLDARTANSWTFGGYAMTAAGDNFCGDMDELRVFNGAASADYLKAEYLAMLPDTLAAGSATVLDVTAPVFGRPTVTLGEGGVATVSVTVTDGSGTLSLVGNGNVLKEIGEITTLPQTFETTTSIPENECWSISVLGVNAKGTRVEKAAVSGVMNAAVAAEKTSDAEERGLAPGSFAISRGAGAADQTLIVNLTFGGTAVAGRDYVDDLPESVIIPAGETETTIVVKPIKNAIEEDLILQLTVAAGTYVAGATASMTIKNLVTNPDYNTWIAASAGLASEASNWSYGHAPTAGEAVLFDGEISACDCNWDSAASMTVGSWKQLSNYTGTVTIDTEFSGAALTISGDVELLGGKWTHRGNYNNYGAAKESNTSKLAAKKWCLNVAVGGNLTVASGASINVTGKGFGHPGNQSAPCYGGYAYNNDQSCAPYGSITEPFDPGMGCRSQGDQNGNRSGIGGGAVKLAVAGDLIVDGSISALGNVDLNVARSGGTGGSIWIDARQISGAGKIDASACPPSNYTSDQGAAVGSGGRIALYTKSALAISRDNLVCNGSAYQGTGGSKTKVGSCGTIFIKDSAMANGVLLLKQDSSIITVNSANSAVPQVNDLALDGIEFRGRAVLAVETGKTLTLPGGFASVTSDSTTIGANGISYRGGVINSGTGNQTISGWMLEPVSNFNFAADVALSNYGAIGIIKRNICGTGDAPIPPRKVAFTVAGDMTVDATSAVDVGNVVGYSNYGSGQRAGWYGGWTTYYDKNGNQTGAHENTYGSVFDPQDFGSSPTRSFLAGGAINMAVVGNLDLDGRVTASGLSSDNTSDGVAPSSGGSVKMSIGSLTGTGSITACAGAGRYAYAGGGAGGRIAIKLTDTKAAIPDTIVVNAGGSYGYAFNANATKLGSAGTVYIETAADGAKGGTLTISNWKDRSMSEFTSATVFPTTPIVAYNNGDAVADFKRAKLVVTNNAIAEVSVADLKMRGLEVAANSRLDLNGNTLTVYRAKLGGTKLKVGTYAADNEAVAGFVSDSVGGGSLVVNGVGIKLILR